MHTFRWAPALAAVLLAAPLCGCSPEPAPPRLESPVAQPPAPAPAVAPAGEAAANAAAPPLLPEDVLERVARGGDPFQPGVTAPPAPPRDDRPRKSARYAVDELKLVAVVHAGDSPRAMVVDPRGRGWVLRQGDLVGRAELVRVAGDDRREGWRVDRIRARDVVLVRDTIDAASAGPTRVLELPPDPIALGEDDEVAL